MDKFSPPLQMWKGRYPLILRPCFKAGMWPPLMSPDLWIPDPLFDQIRTSSLVYWTASPPSLLSSEQTWSCPSHWVSFKRLWRLLHPPRHLV